MKEKYTCAHRHSGGTLENCRDDESVVIFIIFLLILVVVVVLVFRGVSGGSGLVRIVGLASRSSGRVERIVIEGNGGESGAFF